VGKLEAIKAALDLLINHHEYHKLRKDVEKLVDIENGVFTGDLNVLNVLVYIGRENSNKLARLWEIADSKRRSNKGRKVAYQQAYMRARRSRETKAVKLEEALRGRAMTPDEKKTLRQQVHTIWMLRREDMLSGFEGSGRDKNELVAAFWEEVDSSLDKALAGDTKLAQYVLGHNE
jgi:hypothetical protein